MERVKANVQVRRIELAVRDAERRIMYKKGLGVLRSDELATFHTNGPRGLEPIYEATRPMVLQAHFEELTLPSAAHYASFGSGLGMDSFLASFHFRQVTGYEIDPEMHAGAEAIRRQFGLDNVRLINGNFLKLDREKLEEFDIIYLYRPFGTDFFEKTGRLLMMTKPETVVISHYFYDENLFPPSHYRVLHPKGWRPGEEFIYSKFFTFKRIEPVGYQELPLILR